MCSDKSFFKRIHCWCSGCDINVEDKHSSAEALPLPLSLHDNKWFGDLFYPCSIYYYSCDVLQLNLSHLAARGFSSCLESGFIQYWGCIGTQVFLQSAFPFHRIVLSVFHLRGHCLSFHSFSLLLLVFWVRGWLMWVYPTIQPINAGLSTHPSSTHPPGNHPVC